MTTSHAEIGSDCRIDDGAEVGRAYEGWSDPAVLGDGATVRSGTIVYADVEIGSGFTTGHDALVRERTEVGDDVLVGTGAVVDGRSTLGSRVSLQTRAYVPTHTTVGDDVFVGPGAVLTNDPYPLRRSVDLRGPTIESGASIGGNATVLPDVTVGHDGFVAAGAVVTEDVPPDTLAVGVPAVHRPLPAPLEGGNGGT
ncbi:MAG: DapH/DapD/GlmU-related protein [Haloferacaceae archaeon]